MQRWWMTTTGRRIFCADDFSLELQILNTATSDRNDLIEGVSDFIEGADAGVPFGLTSLQALATSDRNDLIEVASDFIEE